LQKSKNSKNSKKKIQNENDPKTTQLEIELAKKIELIATEKREMEKLLASKDEQLQKRTDIIFKLRDEKESLETQVANYASILDVNNIQH